MDVIALRPPAGNPRLTHNAVLGYQRSLAPENSISGAYGQLKRACARGRFQLRPPAWLRKTCKGTEGYLILEDEIAALPIRRGRAVACLANPLQSTCR